MGRGSPGSAPTPTRPSPPASCEATTPRPRRGFEHAATPYSADVGALRAAFVMLAVRRQIFPLEGVRGASGASRRARAIQSGLRLVTLRRQCDASDRACTASEGTLLRRPPWRGCPRCPLDPSRNRHVRPGGAQAHREGTGVGAGAPRGGLDRSAGTRGRGGRYCGRCAGRWDLRGAWSAQAVFSHFMSPSGLSAEYGAGYMPSTYACILGDVGLTALRSSRCSMLGVLRAELGSSWRVYAAGMPGMMDRTSRQAPRCAPPFALVSAPFGLAISHSYGLGS